MRLDPTEVAFLPLPAALVDRLDAVVASSREWSGAALGSVCYYAGGARLLVSPDSPARPDQQAVTRRLLHEMRLALAAMPAEQAICAAVLSSGLELVAGWPPDERLTGAVTTVLEHTRTVISARVPEVEVEVVPPPAQAVPAPTQIVLALLQLAANASAHEDARHLRLRVGVGPTFFVEWPAAGAAAPVPSGQSHPALRQRWGLGYVRMVADFLGATALPPGPTAPGWRGPCLSLGSRRLTLPLAVFQRGSRVRCSQTWEQAMRSLDPDVPSTIAADLGRALAAAEGTPGRIVREGLLCARATPAGTWVAVSPQTEPERVRDLLRGLDHERALWTAPEPHASRVHGLISLLGRSLGDVPTAYAPEAFERDFPRACAALGVETPALGPVLACPDARTTAFLLSELGGNLVVEAQGTFLKPGARAGASPLAALLELDGLGRIRLTPSG